MLDSNRRLNKRLKIDRQVKIPVQLFPVMPFIGNSIEAGLINISGGGMALTVDEIPEGTSVRGGMSIKIHFHLPGQPIQECRARITHKVVGQDGRIILGVRFMKPPKALVQRLDKMVLDNDDCNRRIREMSHPTCDIKCAFFQLCRKPIRLHQKSPWSAHLEIAIQSLDETYAA